ncbi:EAL domain-containing protein [Brevibacillus agri]|uniref:sensor domain-containing protein n=1 Tax=Brevibacillus agri TaxID=51101 RepID=UPI0002E0177C|nr:EAL domain-containing protein [Brevibacillus agri]MDR9506880.1 EAL domain-containing protein [Brevibacillus agri]
MKSTRHQLFSPPVDAFLGSSSSALHEALLQPILEHMEAGVTVYGLDGRIPFFKEAAKRFGMSEPIDLHERTYGSYSFYHPDGSTPASFAELPSVRVLHQENVYNQEIWVQPPGKAVSILVANGKLLYASSGEPVGALIVTHDITKRKQTEETWQIVPIGRWVLEMACQQCVKWQQQGLPPVRLAVNLSMRQLQDKQLVPMVQQILQKTGLHPRYLELEITESIAMHRLDAVIPRLQTLQAMGIQISIDDFGTGYSSLSCLQLLPINSLKIDQSFMRNMTDSSSHMPIVTAIAAMAHSLQLSLVAEGVETAKQLAFLRSLGCLTVQGYFFSKPVPADEREAAGGQLALPVLIAGFVL